MRTNAQLGTCRLCYTDLMRTLALILCLAGCGGSVADLPSTIRDLRARELEKVCAVAHAAAPGKSEKIDDVCAKARAGSLGLAYALEILSRIEK